MKARIPSRILHLYIVMGQNVNVDRLTIFGKSSYEHFQKDAILLIVSSLFCYFLNKVRLPFVDPNLT